jgi:hypothetical protein
MVDLPLAQFRELQRILFDDQPARRSAQGSDCGLSFARCFS